MAVRLQLENGKVNEYATYWASNSGEPEEKTTYRTKCGLHFEEQPKGAACNHLDCAIYLARSDALVPLITYMILLCTWPIFGWYFDGDPLGVITQNKIYLIIFSIIMMIADAGSLRSWLELMEFKKHGTIHGVKASIS